MKARCSLQIVVFLASLSVNSWALATLLPLTSPVQITYRDSINFDGYPDMTVSNTLFQSQGITFTRDDSASLFIVDWSARRATTTSPPNVIASISGPGVSPWVTHLNVLSSTPLLAAGAYFGNDQGDFNSDFRQMRMSVFGLSNNLLGSVDAFANNNTSVDQFIGVQSDIPFSRIRFDNLAGSGTQSVLFSVVLDDFVFAATVPEPFSLSLVGFGSCMLLHGTRRRRPLCRSRKLAPK